MIEFVGKFLKKIGELEIKHYYLFVILILLFTGFNLYGITKIHFQSDLDKMNPQDLDVVKINNEIESKFSDADAIIVLIQIDEDSQKNNQINDIRDPEVIEFTKRLTENLLEDSRIQEVQSAGLFFPEEVPETLGETKAYLSQIPQADSIFSDDYSFTMVNIIADIGEDQDKIIALNEKVMEIIEESSPPGGIKTSVTGNPPLMAVMMNLLISDSFKTLLYAAIFIFVLLFVITRAISKSTMIMVPLIFGLSWTMGTLGWAGVPITIATAGLSSMLLGLGVEYSIFLFSRYEEEKKKSNTKDSIIKALSTTGASTVSSGLTTVIGFAVLTFSIFPMISDMGFSLATGIGYLLASTMIVLPLTILTKEKLIKRNTNQNGGESNKLTDSLTKGFKSYGKFVSTKPIFVIIVGFLITILMFQGMQMIENKDIEFDTVLPADFPELIAYNTIFDEIGQSSSINIFVKLDPTELGTDEPKDIRDQRVISYIDILSQKVKYVSHFSSVSSISEFEKENLGEIPGSLVEQREELSNYDVSEYITEDYSATIIRIKFDISSQNSEASAEIVRQINEIVDTTLGPAGVETVVSGGLSVDYELTRIQNPDTAKTSIYALIGIIVLLLILSRSFKYTFLPLITVVLGILWTLGIIGFAKVPFSSITSTVITMTIGIGIDFGLQLSMRFRQEREEGNEKRKAMEKTLKNTLYPMVITALAAIIGFSTMRLGQLNIMGDLGTSMSFSIVACMLVAISIVAGLIVLFERQTLKKKNISKK